MVENKNRVVQNNVSGLENLFKKHHIDLIKGTARLVDSRTVDIRDEDGEATKRTADALVVATGQVYEKRPVRGRVEAMAVETT